MPGAKIIQLSTSAAYEPTLFPFAQDVDPAIALNARASREGWTVRCDTQLAFDRQELGAVRELWRTLCRPGHLPKRLDFTFPMLKPFLRDVVIMELARDRGRLRYLHRFVGSAVVARMGELTGTYLDAFLPPAIYEKTAVYFDAVVTQRCPLRVVTDFSLAVVNHVRGEAFVIPLADDGTNPNMLMSVTYFTQRPGA